MSQKKKLSREDIAFLNQEERMKYEVAEELGLLEKVLEGGWKTLTSKETGRIGGIISKRRTK